MRALPSILCLTVYMASLPILSPPADAASLRISAGKSTNKLALASLSAAEARAITALSDKYNCDLGAKSLSTTLKVMIARGQAASHTLSATCSEAKIIYKYDLAHRLDDADRLAATADRKGEAVYATGKAAAHRAFDALKSKHEMSVQDANAVLEDARAKETMAAGIHNDKGAARLEAGVLFEQESQLLDETVTTLTRALRDTRDSVINRANASRAAEIAMAKDDLEISYGECKHAYDARISLVDHDRNVIRTQIAPLVSALNSCGDSGSAAVKAVGSSQTSSTKLLEIDASTPCKLTLHSKILRLQQSFIQLSAHAPPDGVAGKMSDWRARLATERSNSQSVRKACEAEARGIFNSTLRGLDTIYVDTVRQARNTCDTEVAAMEDRTALKKVALKAPFDATRAPAFAAQAELDIARADTDNAKAAAAAASDLKAFTLNEAQSAREEALLAAEQAKRETIRNIKAEAEVLRESARTDLAQKSASKSAECEAGHEQLEKERALIGEILRRITTLVTVPGEMHDKGKAEAADLESRLACEAACQHGGSNCTKVSSNLSNNMSTNTSAYMYACSCVLGYSGQHCEVNHDRCASTPCKNGGECVDDNISAFMCACTPGWSGSKCQVEVNACDQRPCGDHGHCTDDKGRYVCHCDARYEGSKCENYVEDCQTNSCANGAMCNYTVNGYECICASGFAGTLCDMNKGTCSSGKNCKHGGRCTDGLDGQTYRCECTPGFQGAHCETEIDACGYKNPCKNGGSCVNSDGNYTCECLAGFSGVDCSVNSLCPLGTACKWCVTQQQAMCTKVHWTFPEKGSEMECAARCEAAETVVGWGCTSFTHWQGHCWLCEPPGAMIPSRSSNANYYQKVSDFEGKTCIEGEYKSSAAQRSERS